MRIAILLIACIFLVAPQASEAQNLLPRSFDSIDCKKVSKRTCLKDKAIKILHQIAGDDLQAYFGFTPEIQVIGSNKANAFAVKNTNIFLSNKLFDKISDSKMLAFVLLHEIGHLKLHTKQRKFSLISNQSKLYDHRIYQEAEADEFACRIIRREMEPQLSCIKLLRKLGKALDSRANMEVRAQILKSTK